MAGEYKTVFFKLDGKTYALHLDNVDTILRAVEITPLPKAPDIVLGIINMHGEIIPIVDVRKRFSLRPKKISLTDQIIVVKTSRRKIGIFADSTEGYREIPSEQVINNKKIWKEIEYLDGVIKISDDLVLINNLEKFLLIEEEEQLNKAME